jgi:hypothetical protein
MIIDLTCSLVREIALLDSVVCLKAVWQLHQAVGIELVLDCLDDNTVCCSRH